MTQNQLIALAAAAVLIFWMVGAYNRLVNLRNAIGQAWAKVDEALRQRSQAAVPLLAALREPLAAEQGALAATTSRLLALLEQHHELRVQDAIATGARGWKEADARLAFSRQLFNEAASAYNSAIVVFPTKLLLRMFHFGPAGRI